MDALGSALGVPVRLPRPLELFRAAHVPNAALGVPAHVTLIYPFIPADGLDASVRASIAECLRSHASFEFSASHLRSWPGVLYLSVDPAAPFEALVASLGDSFPDYPPYAGEFPYVPHVTIGEGAAGDPAGIMPPVADVRLRADRVLLISEGADGLWRTRWQFALRRDDGTSA
jgi:2'-5' RNA ligase